jgi:hypothetical protein
MIKLSRKPLRRRFQKLQNHRRRSNLQTLKRFVGLSDWCTPGMGVS